MSKTTTLVEDQLTQSPNDTITIELIQPDDMPPVIRVTWPTAPTITTPSRFNAVAAEAMKSWRTPALATSKSGLNGDADSLDGGLRQTD